jgi:diguanylate cyclase (GGDEF)-like protein/PAS domain S-box-containing protein
MRWPMSRNIREIIIILLFMMLSYSFFSGEVVLGADIVEKLLVSKNLSVAIGDIYGFFLENELLFNRIMNLMVMINLLLFLFLAKFYKDYKENSVDKKELSKKLKDQNLLLDDINIHVWTFKDEETYGLVNKAHAEFINKSKEEIEDQNIYNIYPKEEAERSIKCNSRVFREKVEVYTEEIYKDKNGEDRILAITRTPRLDEIGQVDYLICSAADITAHKMTEEKIRSMTYYDSLTGLYNRRYYEYILPKLDREDNLPLSIIVADLNGLKLANDVFGHEAGDRLLKTSARILKDSIRGEDVVIRWGGDEFCALLPNTGAEEAQIIIERIKSNCLRYDLSPFSPNIALGTATKYTMLDRVEDVFNKAEDRMYKQKSEEKNNINNPILSSLIERFLNNGYEEEEHLVRVRELSLKFGNKLGLSDNLIHKLFLLAEFHDIGRLTVSSGILQKRGELNKGDLEELDKHIEAGYNIAKNFKILNPISELILYHHENWDGSGYPIGLRGKEIPLLSRVLRIIDAYDIMVNGRPYRQAISKEEAIKILKAGAGAKYDPELVDEFIDMIEDKQEVRSNKWEEIDE